MTALDASSSFGANAAFLAADLVGYTGLMASTASLPAKDTSLDIVHEAETR